MSGAQPDNKRRGERHPWLVSYGRRRGRAFRRHKSGVIESLLPKLLITRDGGENSPEALANSGQPLWLEIGFGGGEHLAAQAERHQHVLFIGCEPYRDGVANLVAEVEERGLDNVRVWDEDARFILEALPDTCISRVFILFPDPWPKIRHQKRRIISQETLSMLAQVMKPGAELLLATDHEDYAIWMLEHVLAHGGFEWTAREQSDWLNPPEGWVRTRYQEKAEAQGRKAVFFRFIRR